MSSDFSDKLSVASPSTGWKERLVVDSSRFYFFKTRVYGALQLIKEVKPSFAADLTTLESLRKEFYIGFSLNHPAITRYYKFEENRVYEEYIDGLTIREMIERGDKRLRSNTFVDSIVRQLFDALDYLHSRGIIHRDIKPENIMVTHREDRLKIIDFGAAESAEYDTTPGYTASTLAPEQEDLHADVQTDIYQAGLVVAELCENIPGKNRWKSFIRMATEAQPSRRFKSSQAAIEALPRDRKRKVSGLVFIIFGILIIFTGAIGYVLRMSYSGAPQSATETDTPRAEVETSLNEEAETPAKAQDPISPPQKEPSAPSKERLVSPATDLNLNSTLQKKIKEYVGGCLSTRVGKYMTSSVPLDDEGTIRPGYAREFHQSYQQAFEDVKAYCAQLSAQYPKDRDMIEETAYKTFESRGSVYVIRFGNIIEEAKKKLEKEELIPIR